MYALKNKHRQVTLQKFLCKSCLKESQRRDGNDQSDGDVPFISIGFPNMSITEDNYNYRMVAQKYQEQLNQKNTTRYHFSINQCTSKTILHLSFYLLIMQYNSGSQRKIPSSSVPLWQACSCLPRKSETFTCPGRHCKPSTWQSILQDSHRLKYHCCMDGV